MSNEDILGASRPLLVLPVLPDIISPALQQKSWSAGCYEHFRMPPNIVVSADGKVKYQFVCKKCVISLCFKIPRSDILSTRNPSMKITRARHDVSTSNLKNHAESCAPSKDPRQGTLNKDIAGANYSKAKFRYLLLRWIVLRHRPFAIVDDPELVEAFQMLYDSVTIPSARTVSRDVQEVFEMTKQEVVKRLQVSKLSTFCY